MKLKELIEQATPLPWKLLTEFGNRIGGGFRGALVAIFENPSTEPINHPREEANAKLATHAVNMLPKLVDALEALMDADKRNELHRDPLDTDAYFKTARSVLAEANNL